jgi:hypothetical protein
MSIMSTCILVKKPREIIRFPAVGFLRGFLVEQVEQVSMS